MFEDHIDTSWSSGHTTDKVVQHVWGARYIDDLVLNRLDADNDGDYSDSGSSTHYALTDHQFSVVALISPSSRLIESVSYDAYGTAQHHWMQDVDGDGDIDANDESLTTNASGNSIYQSGYNVDADFNRDGVINSTDTSEVTSSSYTAAIRADESGTVSLLSCATAHLMASPHVLRGIVVSDLPHHVPMMIAGDPSADAQAAVAS